MSRFIQTDPQAQAPYSEADRLCSFLKRLLPPDQFASINQDLLQFSQRLEDEITAYADDAIGNPPQHIPFSPWGKRIDEIRVSRGWEQLDRISAEEGIVAIAYERKSGAYSRLHQIAKLMLFHPHSAFYSCPLAMTDGAARLIELHGDESLKKNAFRALTSRDPKSFWTSGQWMTERTGGSDLGRSETIATKDGDSYKLNGVKWFTSATSSQMAMTLARIEDSDGNVTEGSRGLSLFYLKLRDDNNELQGIEIFRLKDKLGTKALPTAELELKNCRAQLVGEAGHGVKTIASLFNVTRVYNATTCASAARHILGLAKDYANKREAFGLKLKDHPLHVKELARITTDTEAITAFVVYIASLMGKDEVDHDKASGALLRLLTPVAKLYTAKINMNNTSELIESFGGAGFIEDTGLPMWLRDAQVLTIWEGTTNVLSLDLLRAIQKENVLVDYQNETDQLITSLSSPELSECKKQLKDDLQKIIAQVEKLASKNQLIPMARGLAFAIGGLTASVQLCLQADWEKTPHAIAVAKVFSQRDHLKELMQEWDQESDQLIFN